MNSIYPLNDNDPEDDSGVQVSLGLQREPFSPEPADKDAFYPEQTRSQRLKLLHHLAPYGELLIVTGDPGSGKTTLMQQFVDRGHETWRLCVITAHQALYQGQLLEALAEGFSLQPRPADGDLDKLQLLKSHCVALKRKGLLPMVVIDDAHLLTADALGVLMQLLQSLDTHEKPLRIVLFAAPQLRELLSVPELEGLHERVSHTFNLPPFSEKETANYIQHRLKAAGAGGRELFTDAVITMIHKTSQGQPAKINELAKVVLANKAQGGDILQGVAGDKPKRASKGGQNIVPLGMALAILILVVLYLLHSINSPGPGGGGSQQAPIARNGGQETVPLPLPTDTAPAGPAGGGSAESQAGVPPADQGAGAAPSLGESEPSAMGGAAEDQPPAGEAPAMPSSPAASPPPASVPQTGAAQAPAEGAMAPSGSAGQASGTMAEPAPVKPVVKAPPAPTRPAAAPAKPASTAKAGGGIRDAAWVMAQDPKHFTMQVMATHTPANIDRFVKRRGLAAGDFARFQKIAGGKRWHVLIYGAFAGRGQAEARAKHLPAGLHGVKPWIRPFADVQASIRQFRQSHP